MFTVVLPPEQTSGIMRLAGTQRSGLTDGAAHKSYATIGIGHREVKRPSRYRAFARHRIWRSATEAVMFTVVVPPKQRMGLCVSLASALGAG